MRLGHDQLIDAALLARFAEFVAAILGLHFPAHRHADLALKMRGVARECNYPDVGACMHGLINSRIGQREIEILARHLTVGETYFFREPASFTALEQQVLPQLIAERRRSGRRYLRIWCAACCTGEEPYSVAMLLDRLLPDRDAWHLSILATDINPKFLQQAVDGVYTGWSFRGEQQPWVKDYFEPAGQNGLVLQPRIREMVTFAYLNLTGTSYPAIENQTNGMDLIFCRNVLMYFDPEQVQRVARKLDMSLVDGGWLIVGATEIGLLPAGGLQAVSFPGINFFHKQAALPASELAAPPWAPALALTERAATPPPRRVATASPAQAAKPYEVALGHYAVGAYAQVVTTLAKHSDKPRAMRLIARAHANLGQLDEALRWCRKAITADKCDPVCYYLLSAILDELGRTEEAFDALKRVLYLEPGFVLAHLSLGTLCRRLGRAEGAKYFANVLQLLADRSPAETVAESEGMTVEQLTEIARLGSEEWHDAGQAR